MAFQLLFLFSFVLESTVFHEDEVSSLNELFMYSYGHPGSISPTVITKKDAYMIYDNLNNATRSLQATGFRKKTRSKISVSSACFVGQM